MINARKILAILVAVAAVTVVCVYFGMPLTEQGFKPVSDLDSDFSMSVEFSGTELNEETRTQIGLEVLTEIMPYKSVKYDKVNISIMEKGGKNEEAVNRVRENSLESVVPTVRRVLPDTAEKFYLPKTLLSVTWTPFRENPTVVSVLVDPDERKAVNVWSNLGD